MCLYWSGRNKINARTMVLEERDEPPRFARAGAVRWMRRKVVMNGVEPCDILVRYRRRFWRKELVVPSFLDIAFSPIRVRLALVLP